MCCTPEHGDTQKKVGLLPKDCVTFLDVSNTSNESETKNFVTVKTVVDHAMIATDSYSKAHEVLVNVLVKPTVDCIELVNSQDLSIF